MAEGFRIGTFNLESFGAEPDAETLERRVRVLRPALERMRADILCLQEVDARHPAGDKHAPRTFAALDRLVAGTRYADYARAATRGPKGGPRDRHNLLVLSRLPIAEVEQVRHALVAPPRYRPRTASPEAVADEPIEWDRPFLHVTLLPPGGRPLNVLNLHLRAPRAAFVAGQKETARTWRTLAGWAEGFFLATVKQAGQALEARLLIERLFDADADARVAVLGDLNAPEGGPALRLMLGDEEDGGNPAFAPRRLVALERGIDQSRRFSVIHRGRREMVDHVLVSQNLMGRFRAIEVHNETLGDEVTGPDAVRAAPESFHAPVVAEFAAG